MRKRHTTAVRDVQRVVSRTPQLAHFIERCQFHAAIASELRTRLPNTLADHCLSCVAHPDRVVVFTNAAVRATLLRFAVAAVLPDLARQFNAEWRCAEIKILATWQPDRRLRELRQPLAATIAQMESAADYSPSQEVHAALARLARTLRNRVR